MAGKDNPLTGVSLGPYASKEDAMDAIGKWLSGTCEVLRTWSELSDRCWLRLGWCSRMFENLAHAERIELAKAKMEKVIDHFLYVLELHANNTFIIYTPSSFVANSCIVRS
jgi:hypothetical protein